MRYARPRCGAVLVIATLIGFLSGCSTGVTASSPATGLAAEPESAPGAPGTVADTPGTSADTTASAAAKAAKKEAKRAKLERDLRIAHERVTKARLELSHQEAENAVALDKATAEHTLATDTLANFDAHGAPLRLERAKLALKRAEDSHQESTEELQQLEMMYSEEELGDKTAEIVIIRAKRRLARARWSLDIQRTETTTLETRTIPLERRQLELSLRDKSAAVAARGRAAEASELSKRIGMMSAESEVQRIESELEQLDADE